MGESLEPKRPNRRDVLKVLTGAALSGVLPSSPEAQERSSEYLPSSLDEKALEAHKEEAARELTNKFWSQPKIKQHITGSIFGGEHRRSEIERVLVGESRMYIPDQATIEILQKNQGEQLAELSKHIPEQKHGLYIDGNAQAMYVLHNEGKGATRFVKAYTISTSRNAWGNDPNSGATPLGLHYIAEGRKGMLGEVVSPSQQNSKEYAKVPVREKGKTVQKNFVRDLLGRRTSVAEIITSAFLLTGPTTPPTRAIFIHGTNKIHMLGQADSGGCIRMSNVDVYDVAQYVDITMGKLLKYGKKMPDIRTGTPVMVGATMVTPPLPTPDSPPPPPEPLPPPPRDPYDPWRPRPPRWND